MLSSKALDAELMQKYVIDFDKEASVYTRKVNSEVQFKLVKLSLDY